MIFIFDFPADLEQDFWTQTLKEKGGSAYLPKKRAFFSCGDSHQKGKKKRKKRRKRGEKKRKKRRKREKNAPAGRVEQKNGARRAPRHLNPSINRILSVFWVP
jgi:hypothetical protein